MINEDKFYRVLNDLKVSICDNYGKACRNKLQYSGNEHLSSWYQGRATSYEDLYIQICIAFSDENICGDEDE